MVFKQPCKCNCLRTPAQSGQECAAFMHSKRNSGWTNVFCVDIWGLLVWVHQRQNPTSSLSENVSIQTVILDQTVCLFCCNIKPQGVPNFGETRCLHDDGSVFWNRTNVNMDRTVRRLASTDDCGTAPSITHAPATQCLGLQQWIRTGIATVCPCGSLFLI